MAGRREWVIGLVSDTHCFSRYALTPPQYWPAGGAGVLPEARILRYLWACWRDFVRRCPPLDVLIHVGDVIEGEVTRRDALDALSDDLNLHYLAARDTLRPLVRKARSFWVVAGTPAHEGKHHEVVEAVARDLGAERWAAQRSTGLVLELRVGPLLLNATHHMTRGALYMGSLADRTALLAAAAVAEGHTAEADLIVRAHLHMPHVSHAYGKWVILQPGWKMPNPYAYRKIEYYRAHATLGLGANIVRVSARGTVSYEFFRYPPWWRRPRAAPVARRAR